MSFTEDAKVVRVGGVRSLPVEQSAGRQLAPISIGGVSSVAGAMLGCLMLLLAACTPNAPAPAAPAATGAVPKAAATPAQTGNQSVAPPATTTGGTPDAQTPLVEPQDLAAKGDPNAPVTLVEFADFQCPFCRRLTDETMPQVIKDFVDKGQVYVVYFDFPFLGQESLDAAEAGRCAQDQGKFWEFHDLLFKSQTGENVGDFKRENLNKFAQQLGLEMTAFGQCMDTHKYKDFIQAELSEGRRIGVRSTPTLIVNQRAVPGFVPYLNEQTERSLLVAPGVTMTGQDKLKAGSQVCMTGEVDSNRRISKGTVTDPPGDAQSLCGKVKQFKAATADQAGEITLETIVQGLKEIIEEELKKPR